MKNTEYLQRLDEALSNVRTGYADVAVNKTSPVLIAEYNEEHIGAIVQAAALFAARLREEIEGTGKFVPCEATGFDWWFEYMERKPYKLIDIGHSVWAVVENYLTEIDAKDVSLNDTFFCEKFSRKDDALSCYQMKTAQHIYKAAIQAAPSRLLEGGE